MAALPRVLLVDDSDVLRKSLWRALEDRAHVVGEASDGDEVLAAVERCLPEVVLMDVKMARVNGIEATRLVTEAHPDVLVIGLSSEGDAEAAMRAAGAVGFVLKGNLNGLVDALGRVTAAV